MYYGDEKQYSRTFFIALKCFWYWDVLQFFTGKHFEKDKSTGFFTVVKYKPFYKRCYLWVKKYLKKKYETFTLDDMQSISR